MHPSKFSKLTALTALLVAPVLGAWISPEQTAANKRCYPYTAFPSGGTCPGHESCNLTISALLITAKPDCGGCAFFGTMTLTCDGVPLSQNFSRTNACNGSSAPIAVPCPSTPAVTFTSVVVACTPCIFPN